ncbi:gliding motility-associated C-terminal domain-containing protein [Paraflavitalea sp. CAU 1676]|uniref:T9SS type B sorting domain-containing protein n=1 Tax=Paraflavitalea sp. CAU 1676 TaxID=3032598 RepID=UPI0023DA9212|nr:gliding motility-associated C-terminal domain-containing protein [Paraflavitalea sp. CAU 1676]MDF2192787.1 gliding motility-associated C-terminal domain-containing protein [Paraflavitalea sp. CAU 1676]
MVKKWLIWLLPIVAGGMAMPCYAQLQACPMNINFSAGDLSSWTATTGLVARNTQSYTGTNAGLTTIPEYTISTTGVEVITSSTIDHFGKFATIPVINGYAYNYAVKLGSTATSHDLNNGERAPGGFTRAITYTINVPPGSTTVPYTMTYAYAMVLENGTHNSSEQPLFKATLSTQAGVIACASPEYYLPTFNDAGSGGGPGGGGAGSGATLDSATALANGFTNSPEPFLSYGGQNGNGAWLRDVWTKPWTEVVFDLSPYRGQQVTLTFESDNCRPGAHFAYAYVALRNTCAGLEISGISAACTNNEFTYSIPALAGATYTWAVPAGWTINSGANSNIIHVTAGNTGGAISVQQVNSCTDLKGLLPVTTTPPTIPGQVNSDAIVCSGTNTTFLNLGGETGNVLNWLSSTDGTNWTTLGNTSLQYTAQNLTATTRYVALVQNGASCRIDTSVAALVTVDAKTVGGDLLPNNANICLGQTINPILELSGSTGSVVNWQTSYDKVNWSGMSPGYQQPAYQPATLNRTTYYRAILKSGVCPADTSDIAALNYFNVAYPAAKISPDLSTICYGKSATLNALISVGTNYTWSKPGIIKDNGNGITGALPYSLSATATPAATTDVILSVFNTGCPNAFKDTFQIHVSEPVIVDAGRDTVAVVGQQLQLHATANMPETGKYNWSPGLGLSSMVIANPVAVYSSSAPASVAYAVKATTEEGCEGFDTVVVKIFKTAADIFMPSAFSPNGDRNNEFLMPICVGIQQLNFFRLYNRWGQLVFSTTEIGKGWDGRIAGVQQASGTYVYAVQGIDYVGKTVSKKGSFVLVR